MTQHDKEVLIEKLMRHESSDGAGMGVAGIGLSILGGIAKPSGLLAVAGVTASILPVVLIGISVTGLSILALQKFLAKKERGQ